MNMPLRLAIGLVIAAAVIALALAIGPSQRSSPPLKGWMQNFTPADRASPAPDTGFTGPDGQKARMADFRGRVVLVNFWATWCGPCIRELPSLARLAARIKQEGAAVLAISLDRKGWPVMAPFLARVKTGDMAVYHDPGQRMSRAVNIRGLPETILYSRDGIELGRLKGPAEWDSDAAVALIKFYLRQ